jgi:MoxR-like ATPase
VLRVAHRGIAPATLDDVMPVTSGAEIVRSRDVVDAVTVSDEIVGYITAIVRRTRELPSVALGASPRAAVHLLAAARAIAALAGREFVIPEDVQTAVPAVLRHRLLLRPEAELERYTSDDALRSALAMVTVPR